VAEEAVEHSRLSPELLELMLELLRALERRGGSIEMALEQERRPKAAP